jgi:hypothetical protein
MEERFFVIATKHVKLAIKNCIYHQFSGKDKRARWVWFHNFMHRHSQLIVRKPQPKSAARAKCFTTGNILKFFDICEPLLEKILFSPNRLYEGGKTGLSVVQNGACSVVSLAIDRLQHYHPPKEVHSSQLSLA